MTTGVTGSPADGFRGRNRAAGLIAAVRYAILRAWPAHRSVPDNPGDLRARPEVARLNLPALFRPLDRMDLSPDEIAQRLLRQLFELDGDYAEAL
jgi:hypothetical protein